MFHKRRHDTHSLRKSEESQERLDLDPERLVDPKQVRVEDDKHWGDREHSQL